MNRRAVIAALAGGLLAAPGFAEAQPVVRVYRIGFVSPTSSGYAIEAFRQLLKELGYVEGKNLLVEARVADSRSDRLPELFAELIGIKVDVLVVTTTATALAAKKATTTVPIVFSGLFDPVGSGVVASLAHPKGNITGASIGVGGSGLAGKWAELLKEAVPGIAQVAVFWNSANPASASSVREIEAAAPALKVKLELLDAGNAANLDRALAKIGASGAQGIIVTNDPFFSSNSAKLFQFAASKRLPAVWFLPSFADAGGLMGYGASYADSQRTAARHVDKILKGAKPADLPVEQPTHFELVINLKTAKALGLTIPQSLLLRADQVIQ